MPYVELCRNVFLWIRELAQESILKIIFAPKNMISSHTGIVLPRQVNTLYLPQVVWGYYVFSFVKLAVCVCLSVCHSYIICISSLCNNFCPVQMGSRNKSKEFCWSVFQNIKVGFYGLYILHPIQMKFIGWVYDQ